MTHRLRARVYGLVQGVGYRAYVYNEARRIGLTGYVRNLPDGTVEVEAEGPEPTLRNLLALLEIGPPLGEIERVDGSFETGEPRYDFFTIR